MRPARREVLDTEVAGSQAVDKRSPREGELTGLSASEILPLRSSYRQNPEAETWVEP